MLTISLGNGKIEVENGKTVREIISSLKENREKVKELDIASVLNEAIVAAKWNDKLVDLSTPIAETGTLTPITASSDEGLDVLRHSASHIMAQAIQRLFPGVKFGIGPTIKDGFYYDIDSETPISEDDLPKLEAEMEKIVGENIAFVRKEMSKKEAIEFFKKKNQTYKVELIEELPGDTVSLYEQGDFTDLCRGPHLPTTKALKAFKMLSVAGAYWRGNEKNKMLTRIYGTAFADPKAMKDHLFVIEEAKKRDHRKLGRELKLFLFHEEGPGLAFWLPNGMILRNLLIEYMREKIYENDYVEIGTPHMLKQSLWTTSGHMEKYKENMFFTDTVEGEKFAIKPMNCPGGFLLYNTEKHSYRELPLRVAEFGFVHRYEKSGQLHGLLRVRGFTQDDAHIFMTEEQIESEVLGVIRLVDEIYRAFGFDYIMGLSTRPEKSMGSEELWNKATAGLRGALDKFGKKYEIYEGDGAFYGPKIDFMLKDALGRLHQCGTIQLDMNLAERFDLTYVGQDGQDHRVVMIHRAIFGSLERFIGTLIEHYAGKFPVWLSPVQAKIVTVSERFNDYAKDVMKTLKKSKVRTEADLSSEKLGYKIRQATMEKMPYILVIGEKEVESGTVSVRSRDKGELGSIKVEEFLKQILEENANRS